MSDSARRAVGCGPEGGRRRRLYALLAACLIGFGGCGVEKTADNLSNAGGGDRALNDAAPAVELKLIDRAAYDRLLAERRGKVVLVDFWATWCQPCLAQLPHTGELAGRLGERGLAVMTVSLDSGAQRSLAATTVAERAGAAADHFISALGGGPKAMEEFEIASGSAPHYKLYDRSGKLRQVFEVDPAAERQFTPDDIDAAVEKLLIE